MLEINKEEISKFKQEVDKLLLSMEKLKEVSSVNLKISLPSNKAIDRLATLNSTISSVNIKGITELSQKLTGLSALKGTGLGNVNRELTALANTDVVAAIGNLRDVTVAYNKFKSGTQQKSKPENQDPSQKEDTFSSDISSVTKFLNLSRKIEPSRITQTVDALKELSTIKVDEATAKFMENANGVLSSKGKIPAVSKRAGNTSALSMVRGTSSRADITATVATALTVLGSGVFLKKQANTAKEVVDLLSSSEITGLDSFTNRSGIAALGVSALSVANQQRQKNRELVGARLFGEIDPKKLVLQNILGTDFKSSFETIMKNSLSLPADLKDYVLTELYNEDMATAGARYANARKGATGEELKSLDNILFPKNLPEIDVGSYTRFLIQFEGFISTSKVLFQAVLGPSIKTLESAFTKANGYLLSINANSPGFKLMSKILNTFVTSFVGMISLVVEGLGKLGDLIIEYNLEPLLLKVASTLGTLVAGGAILKVIGITTSLLTSLLGFKAVFSLADKVAGGLGGIILGTGQGGKSGKGGGSSGGGLLGKAGGIFTVALAASSIDSLVKHLSVSTENKTLEEYKDEKLKSLLTTVGDISLAGAALSARVPGYGSIPALILAAIGATAHGTNYVMENPEKTRDLLESILKAVGIKSSENPPITVNIVQDKDGSLRRGNAERVFNQ